MNQRASFVKYKPHYKLIVTFSRLQAQVKVRNN